MTDFAKPSAEPETLIAVAVVVKAAKAAVKNEIYFIVKMNRKGNKKKKEKEKRTKLMVGEMKEWMDGQAQRMRE